VVGSPDPGHARRSAQARSDPVPARLGADTALNYRRVIGGTLIGILIVTAIGIPLAWRNSPACLGAAVAGATFLQLDFSRVTEASSSSSSSVFVRRRVRQRRHPIGVTHRAGLTDADGNLPRMKQALIADSFAAMFGALIAPRRRRAISRARPASPPAAAPGSPRSSSRSSSWRRCSRAARRHDPGLRVGAALLYVACIMARGLAEIDWDDITESAPAVVAAVSMPLTYSIATGSGSASSLRAGKTHRRQVRRRHARVLVLRRSSSSSSGSGRA